MPSPWAIVASRCTGRPEQRAEEPRSPPRRAAGTPRPRAPPGSGAGTAARPRSPGPSAAGQAGAPRRRRGPRTPRRRTRPRTGRRPGPARGPRAPHPPAPRHTGAPVRRPGAARTSPPRPGRPPGPGSGARCWPGVVGVLEGTAPGIGDREEPGGAPPPAAGVGPGRPRLDEALGEQVVQVPADGRRGQAEPPADDERRRRAQLQDQPGDPGPGAPLGAPLRGQLDPRPRRRHGARGTRWTRSARAVSAHGVAGHGIVCRRPALRVHCPHAFHNISMP